MTKITLSRAQDLVQNRGETCITFYLPTHKSGEEVINHEDQILFKNQIKEAVLQLQKLGWEEVDAKKILRPAKLLYKDPEFWRFRTNGLVVFLDENNIYTYDLPFAPEVDIHISGYFNVLPLVPMWSGSGEFLLLTLGRESVKLFKGNREMIDVIPIEKYIPATAEEVVGEDYEQSSIQFRTNQDMHGGAVFHGKGDWKKEKMKEETLEYYRVVEQKLRPYLEELQLPMLVAGKDYLLSLYKKTDKYSKTLWDSALPLRSIDKDQENLHHLAWKEIYPLFDQGRKKKWELIQQFRDTERTETEIAKIYNNALGGRVDTLFIERGYDVWGIYDTATGKFRIDQEKLISNVSLVNLLAIEVIDKGGTIYLQQKETMPLSYAPLNALYRY